MVTAIVGPPVASANHPNVAGNVAIGGAVARFIAEVPKVELHVHLVGSAAVSTVLTLAERRPESGVPTDIDALRAFYAFRDFAHFLEVYVAVNDLVRSGDDVVSLLDGLTVDLLAQRVRYAEVTVTPWTHVAAGMPYAALVEGLAEPRPAVRVTFEVCRVPAGVAASMLRKEDTVRVVSPTRARTPDIIGPKPLWQTAVISCPTDVVHEPAHDHQRRPRRRRPRSPYRSHDVVPATRKRPAEAYRCVAQRVRNAPALRG